jgi:hypothetical protein
VIFSIASGWCHPERALRKSKDPGKTRGLSTPAAAASAQDDTKIEANPKNSQTLGTAPEACRLLQGTSGTGTN